MSNQYDEKFLNAWKKLLMGSVHKYGQNTIIKNGVKNKNNKMGYIFLLINPLFLSAKKNKKKIVKKGNIIPITLRSVASPDVIENVIACLNDGL